MLECISILRSVRLDVDVKPTVKDRDRQTDRQIVKGMANGMGKIWFIFSSYKNYQNRFSFIATVPMFFGLSHAKS